MTPHQMATTWLNIWLEGAGIHGLQPDPDEPLLRWLLRTHERAVEEEANATEGLSDRQAAMLDELRTAIITTQRDTLPAEAQEAVRSGDILAVRAAETAALVWTLAAIDAYASTNDTIPAWRTRLTATAAQAEQAADRSPAAAPDPGPAT